MTQTPTDAPASAGFWGGVLAWCRRYPAVAALAACNLLLLVAATVGQAALAFQAAELRRENEQLRRELDAFRHKGAGSLPR